MCISGETKAKRLLNVGKAAVDFVKTIKEGGEIKFRQKLEMVRELQCGGPEEERAE